MTTENKVTNYKYHSTVQFRNVVKSIRDQTYYQGYDEVKEEAIFDYTKIPPKLTYIGTTKLHGTNASIIIHEDGVISFHSKSQLLGYVRDGEFTLNNDNAEFAQTMHRRIEGVLNVVSEAKKLVVDHCGELIYPIKVSGEWTGSGIQSSVGISHLSTKALFIFGLKVGDDLTNPLCGWLPVEKLEPLQSNSHSIYSIVQFDTQKVEIDFNNPEYSQNILVEHTNTVEQCCPVAKALGTKFNNGEDSLLGEGLVWTPLEFEYCRNSGNHFKTKGEKHSVSKTKSVAEIDPVKLASIKEFVEYSVTENRLDQGITEVGGVDQKLIGKFIGWVNKDINKEEGDVLEANGLTMKDVGKFLSSKAKEYYFGKLNQL